MKIGNQGVVHLFIFKNKRSRQTARTSTNYSVLLQLLSPFENDLDTNMRYSSVSLSERYEMSFSFK